jgi:hypothetical protein
MKLTNVHDKTITNPTEPLEIEGCTNLTIINPVIKGGPHNIEVYQCSGVVIKGGTLTQPKGTSDDPEDPEGHNVLFNGCVGCVVTGTTMTGTVARGDAINFFNSKRCSAVLCTVSGPIAKYGTAAIIDGPKGGWNVFDRIKVLSPNANINLCGGANHTVQDCNATGAFAVTGEYYKGATVVNPKLIRCSAPYLYVHKPTVFKIVYQDCKFAETEIGR